ncbi:MAG: CCDC90 family protein [Rhodocyclaceae bacterium]|nr:CCDC90 family protein [Rhodocyclaceae bacterium]
MATITFDTHKFVKQLTEAGMPLRQAEILAEEQARLIDDRLATKDDLERLELRLTLRLGTMMAASIAVVAALVKLL